MWETVKFVAEVLYYSFGALVGSYGVFLCVKFCIALAVVSGDDFRVWRSKRQGLPASRSYSPRQRAARDFLEDC